MPPTKPTDGASWVEHCSPIHPGCRDRKPVQPSTSPYSRRDWPNWQDTSLTDLSMPEAADNMVVHHSCGLHEGIADGGTHKLESPLPEILAHCIRLARPSRDLLQRTPCIHLGFPTDKLPDIRVEATELVLNGEEGLGVLNGRSDLEPISHDAGIGKELPDFLLVILGDRRRI